ncbi:hypothetical protein M1328_04880 [Patescibacteria group bacterium]|nr:hypothetical protein [Patescibacteria group bacterium]
MNKNQGEAWRRIGYTLKTGAETSFNMLQVPLALAAISLLGVHGLTPPGEIFNMIGERFRSGPEPFLAGLITGGIKNAASIALTLKNLEGKTEGGTMAPLRRNKDGTVVAQITCVDTRRYEKTGGAIPGSFAVLGSEFTSILMAAGVNSLVNSLLPGDNPIGNFLVGYNVGANILTEGHALVGLIGQMVKIVKRAHQEYPGSRVKLIMEDHWDGCGAEGFTSIASFIAKFGLHNKFHLADLLGAPNEIFGYAVVNTVLSPLVAILSGGQVSLNASVKHSQMHKH